MTHQSRYHPWQCGADCNVCYPKGKIDPAEREYKRLVASDNEPLSLGHEPITIPYKVPFRVKLNALLIVVILAWCAINGFYILTHTW